MARVVLSRPVRYPFGFDNVYKMGSVLDVSEDDASKLREMGVIADEVPEPVAHQTVDSDPQVEESPDDTSTSTAPKYGPLPKKSQGANAWREYAREYNIDVRGLSEKPELMGHIIKVVNGQ